MVRLCVCMWTPAPGRLGTWMGQLDSRLLFCAICPVSSRGRLHGVISQRGSFWWAQLCVSEASWPMEKQLRLGRASGDPG